jgi:hypothetical protein
MARSRREATTSLVGDLLGYHLGFPSMQHGLATPLRPRAQKLFTIIRQRGYSAEDPETAPVILPRGFYELQVHIS